MSPTGVRSRMRTTLPACVPILVAVVLSALLVADQHDHARLRADATVRGSVASAVTVTKDAIQTQLAAAAAGTAEGGETLGALGEAASKVSLATRIEARDSGAPAIDDAAAPPTIVVPTYRPGVPLVKTADRRQAITAYRVVPLSLATLIKDQAPAGGGLVVRGPHDTAVSQTGPAPGGARTFGVDLNLPGKVGWRVEGWLPDPVTPRSTWLWVLALLVAAGLGTTAIAVQQRHRRADVERERRLERDRALVTGLAPVVQASLDLARVVPAVATHLADSLALLGLALSVPSAAGERQMFTWGRTPDVTVQPMSTAPTLLEPGETFAVSLTRGGRILGVLRVVAGEPMRQHDLQALATASELLGSTLANAEAFARQQVLMEQLRSVDELKTIFLATASHELRTPVTAIVGFSTLLLQQWDTLQPTQGRQFLERVLSNAKGLETLIEQLLDFSRLERGLHPAGDELLDLAMTTRLILSEQPDLYAGHELRCDLTQGCAIRGSSSAVERIVNNLVGNAAKYSAMGTAITVTVRVDDERVTLLVDDEGAGVPEADRDRVFSRFFRGAGDTVTSTRGAGIGLAIVAEYAASMSGTATVEEAPSGGARFRVSFPVAAPLGDLDPEGAHHVPLA